MKRVFLTLLISTSIFAQYEQGKIDMHGGKDDYSYVNRDFSNNSEQHSLQWSIIRGQSVDQNSSKAYPSK